MPRPPDDHPRPLYYSFAHRALPNMLFRHGEAFRTAALEGRVAIGAHSMWERLALESGAAADATSQVSATAHDCGGRLVVLITPPSAEQVTEAHFIAVVLDRRDESFLRYAVLEFGQDVVTGGSRTVLCEWTASGEHINMGDGPNATAEAFLAVVCEKFTA